MVEQRGCRGIVLHTYWNDMDGELPELIRVVEKEKIEKILIDSYQVTEKYLKILTSHVKTVYIDDRNTFVYPYNTPAVPPATAIAAAPAISLPFA